MTSTFFANTNSKIRKLKESDIEFAKSYSFSEYKIATKLLDINFLFLFYFFS